MKPTINVLVAFTCRQKYKINVHITEGVRKNTALVFSDLICRAREILTNLKCLNRSSKGSNVRYSLLRYNYDTKRYIQDGIHIKRITCEFIWLK